MATNYITTGLKKLKPLFLDKNRYMIVQGGMRSSKTYSILMLIISWCQTNADKVATVASMSYPHLSRGAIRDFQTIMKAAEIWESERWNQSSKIETFGNGTIMEFISVDNMSAHGPARDLLFVNEANDMDRETFEQLAARTTGKIIIDYNPTHKFWAHDWLLKEQTDQCDFIILTYEDNEALAPTIRQYIESKKPKPGEEPSNWWTVYGLGQIGSLEGNVYSGWEEKADAEIRGGGRLIRYGLDFGFSNDETALVAIYEMEDGKTGVVEEIYQKGVLGSQYGELLERHNVNPNVLIVADSARPEIIAEIKKCGFRCIGADKNPGSVKRGIDRVQQRQIVFSGENLKREYLSYSWRKKRTGEVLDEPEDGNDHCLPADTLIDTTKGQRRIGDLVGKSGWAFSEGGKIRRFRNVRQTGVENILKITLANGTVFRCSEDHPVYTTDSGIIPARLLTTLNKIQWVYEKDNQSRNSVRQKTTVQRQAFLARSKFGILPQRRHKTPFTAPTCMDLSQWADPAGHGSGPYRQEQGQQPDRKSASRHAIGEQQECFARDYEAKERTGKSGAGIDKNLACIGGGESVALRAWQTRVSEERAARKNLCSVWEKILYHTILKDGSVLLLELQDASAEAQTKRTPGERNGCKIRTSLRNLWQKLFVSTGEGTDLLREMSKQKDGRIAKIEKDGTEPVYCLDVYDTSNFSIEGGVIVSNCLDALRYAIDDLSRPKFDF